MYTLGDLPDTFRNHTFESVWASAQGHIVPNLYDIWLSWLEAAIYGKNSTKINNGT